ncbi:GNAT family N-acetyltransferase [Sphingomonas sp.]|jgi:putative acetyltransferase|uniref:GNAT family N-acetyltransferase n=1 Tax=Sphingomonas sp. TaxID=28214 RepID=UPI002EDACDCE
MDIRDGGLDDPQVIGLLRLHAQGMLASSPAESCHFLDLSALKAPDVDFWSAWDGQMLAGIGALKQLDSAHGEIKSMRTAPGLLRSGTGAAILSHILSAARARGLKRLSLETGSGEAFEPAIALYRKFGFTDCGAFGEYSDGDPFSRFMTRVL